MKMKKIIPLLALSMLFVAPTFAEDYGGTLNLSDPLQFVVGDFFNMTRNDGVYESNTVNINPTYTAIELVTPLSFGYHVITNTAGTDGVYLSADAPCAGAGDDPRSNALGVTDATTLVLAFTNSTASADNKPDATAISNALLASPTAASNANVIAFPITVVKAAGKEGTGAGTVTAAKDGNTVKYTFTNGEYDFNYSIPGTAAHTKTFSTHDQAGTYKATVKLTRTTP